MSQDLDDLRRKVRIMWWVLTTVATVAMGSAGAAVKSLYGRGYDEGAYRTRLEYLERDQAELQDRIRDLERYSRRRGALAPRPSTTTATRTP